MSKNGDDLTADDDGASKKPAREILREEIQQGMKTLDGPPLRVFISALAAGLEIGFSLLLMGVVLTLAGGDLPRPVRELMVAGAYTLGFLFVVLGRSELFTEQTTLAVLPVLHGLAGVKGPARLWCVVYGGNLIGAAAFAAGLAWFGPAAGAIDRRAFAAIADRMTGHGSVVVLGSGVLAGWMMGQLSWLVAAGRDTISQIAVIFVITAAIGLAGLHHVVAGAAEVFAGMFVGHTPPADAARVLLWTTLGNALGGSLFVAIVKYGHAIRRD